MFNNDNKNKNIKEKIILFFKDKKRKYNNFINQNRSKFTMRETLVFMVVTFGLGLILGGIVMYGKGSFSSHISTSLNDFIATYNDILNTYYKEIDGDKLLESGIEGMVEYLGDPYSSYMDEEESKAFNETVEGEYCGIGAEVIYNEADKLIRIGEVFNNTPASKAGVKTGDILLEVNKKSVTGMTTVEVASIVKGKKGTSVTIKVKRDNEEMSFTMKRDNVAIESVVSEIFTENNKKIGYIGIGVFADNTDEQFEKALKEVEKEKIDSLIIDVRGNSGGYLTTVSNIVSLFVEKGTNIYQLKTKGEIEIFKDKTKDKREYPIVVLANGSSASASELLCACLQESYKATIMGTTTYGKGKVQKAYTLSNGSMVKYTFQEWLTPNGNSIDSKGVEPNVLVEYKYEKDSEIDNQLREAIKVLSSK